MKRATKIAAIALLAGSAVTLSSLAASAQNGFSGKMGGKKAFMGEFMQMEFADIDLDKSGQITVDDLKGKAQARFAEADTNGDGQLDLAEVKAQAEAKMKQRMADGKGAMGGKEGRGWMPSPEKRMTWFAEKMISKRDADGNGTISAAEAMPDQARLDRMIDRFDTDDDNAVSAAEFDQAQKEMWARMKDRKGWGGKGGKHGKGRDCS